MNLGRCPLCIFCSRGAPPRVYHQTITLSARWREVILRSSSCRASRCPCVVLSALISATEFWFRIKLVPLSSGFGFNWRWGEVILRSSSCRASRFWFRVSCFVFRISGLGSDRRVFRTRVERIGFGVCGLGSDRLVLGIRVWGLGGIHVGV